MTDNEFENSFDILIDQQEIDLTVVKKLNSVFGNEVKNIKKALSLFEELLSTQKGLEKSLQFATNEAPDKIFKAIKSAENALIRNEELQQKFSELDVQVENLQISTKSLLDIIGPNIKLAQEVENVKAYQNWVSSVDELSKIIGSNLHEGSESAAVNAYERLQESAEIICRSQCTKLKGFTCQMVCHWYHILIDKFQQDFSSVLKSMKWPMLSENASASAKLDASPDHFQRLKELTAYLLNLGLPYNILQAGKSISSEIIAESAEKENKPSMPSLVADFKVNLIPLQLLLKPLELRFLYHFSGNRATNRRENPEWFFTQVLKWIGNHEIFLDDNIQPILNKNGHPNTSAKVEFMKGLVRLVALKLSSDLPEVEGDEDLFCLTVQETLNFERELRLSLQYPPSQPSVLGVLTQPHIFHRWLSIEQKFASELMDEFVSTSAAWSAEEPGGISNCGEQLVLLLHGINDRYKPLPQPGHRLQFLDLQLQLVDDFRVRILQMTKNELTDLLQSNYIPILNTVHHISATLYDWCDMPFYIEMQFFKEKFSDLQTQLLSSFISSDTKDDFDNSDYSIDSNFVSNSLPRDDHLRQDALLSLNKTSAEPSASNLVEVRGSAFEEPIQLYLHVQTEMLTTIVKHVLTEVRARSQGYRKNKWFLSEKIHGKDTQVFEISPSLCPLLEILVRNLRSLKEDLAPQLFSKIWQTIAAALNKFIYEEVILQNTFSDHGASQLHYDMTKAFFPVFGDFTPNPEAYFTTLKETLTLLTLPRPTALLLKDTLKFDRSEKDFSSMGISPVRALQERGISQLTVQEAATVLNIRTNMA